MTNKYLQDCRKIIQTISQSTIAVYFKNNKKTISIVAILAFFLFFGYYIRNYFEKTYIPWGLPLLVFSLSAIYLFIFHKAYMITFIYSLNWVWFNLAFIYITLRISRSFPLIQVPYINKIGQTSLPIYLWHILPLLFLRSIMDKYGMNIYLYLGLYFLSVTVVIAFIFRFKTSSFMKVMLMGELNKMYIKE